jgi:hypothetical protein
MEDEKSIHVIHRKDGEEVVEEMVMVPWLITISVTVGEDGIGLEEEDVD